MTRRMKMNIVNHLKTVIGRTSALAALAAAFMSLAPASHLHAGTNSLDNIIGKAAVRRLEAISSQRRLQSRTVTNGVMICTYVQNGRSWTTTNRIFSATGYVKPPRYSKLKLYVALSKAGKWQALKEWLQTQEVGGVNAWEAFSLAQDLSADHELFTSWVELAKTALGMDDATVAAILKAAEE